MIIIQYDLMDAGFVFAEKYKKKNAPAHPLLPLHTLLDGRLVNRHMRDIRKQALEHGWTEANLEQWKERADSLAYRFQECRIPVAVMVTDDLDLAKTTFQRVNTQGTAMGEADLVAALTWQPEFDLRDRIKTLREDFFHGWRELPDSIFLQVCKGLADLDITRGDEHDLVKKIKEDPDLLSRASKGLLQAVKLLGSQACVVNQLFLPYQLQLTLLAIELGKREHDSGNPLPEKYWLNWFWSTSWNESFGTATYRKVRNEQTNLRQIEINAAIEWGREPLTPGRFDFRLARTTLFMLRMALRLDLQNHNGDAINGRSLLTQYGRDALSRLFPTPRNATDELKKLVQGAGNQTFYNPDDVKVLRERLLRGPDLSPQVLQALFIDDLALAALRADDLHTFITRRFQTIDAWDKAQYLAIKENTDDAIPLPAKPA